MNQSSHHHCAFDDSKRIALTTAGWQRSAQPLEGAVHETHVDMRMHHRGLHRVLHQQRLLEAATTVRGLLVSNDEQKVASVLLLLANLPRSTKG